MATLSEEAKEYKPSLIKNIADLESVSVELQIQQEKEVEFPYNFVMVNGERYRVPVSVLKDLKVLLEENPNLKKIKVKKVGEGMNTTYTTIPLA